MYKKEEEMRSLVCAICVILAICIFVMFSSVYITSSCDRLNGLIDNLPDSTDTDAFNSTYSLICQKWSKLCRYVRCTVSHKVSEDIDSTLEEVELRFRTCDKSGYKVAQNRLASLIRELSRSEGLSWYAIG